MPKSCFVVFFPLLCLESLVARRLWSLRDISRNLNPSWVPTFFKQIWESVRKKSLSFLEACIFFDLFLWPFGLQIWNMTCTKRSCQLFRNQQCQVTAVLGKDLLATPQNPSQMAAMRYKRRTHSKQSANKSQRPLKEKASEKWHHNQNIFTRIHPETILA